MENTLIYLDDIIIFSSNLEDHFKQLDEVLNRLREVGLKLKPSKCDLLKPEVLYLGHIVGQDGIKPNPKISESISSWRFPKMSKNEIASPLTQLTGKNVKFVWTKDCEAAFTQLKNALMSTPVLAYPNPQLPFILDTDASNTFSSREQVLLRTDHSSLRWLFNFKDPQGQLARWHEVLSQYNFDIQHRAGIKHTNADALSRKDFDSFPVHEDKTDDWTEFHDKVDNIKDIGRTNESIRAVTRSSTKQARKPANWLQKYTASEMKELQRKR
ncbi:unnamed protein product [Mytilus edulis]|uniref:Reverse transcriptase domain-containing protein n=1 Tax=Mytilus edulis TaxID=6550 RepID=A0A8S3UN72_MYTED|nr:unnamed protein product [Mytilus edulis]